MHHHWCKLCISNTDKRVKSFGYQYKKYISMHHHWCKLCISNTDKRLKSFGYQYKKYISMHHYWCKLCISNTDKRLKSFGISIRNTSACTIIGANCVFLTRFIRHNEKQSVMMSGPFGGVSSSSTHLIHVYGMSNRIR